MNRKLPLVVALSLTAATSTPLLALGLGEIEVHSPLSAPLRATLPLTDVEDVDPRRMQVALADQAAFDQAGLSRGLLARGIDFSVERQDGELVVAMRSEQPVRDPFLDLLLDIDWPDGRALRQVTLLFDPPGYEQSPVLVAGAAARVAETSTPVLADASPTTTPRPSAAPSASGSVDPAAVRSGDSLWGVALRLRPGDDIDIHQMMLALVEANPDAFPAGNINSLRAGVTLNVPARDAITRRSPGEASELVQTQNQAWAVRQSDGGEAVAASALSAPAAASADDVEVAAAAQVAETGGGGNSAEIDAMLAAPEEELEMPRLLHVEAELVAGQLALSSVEAERDQLQQEVREMRDELAAMRDRLALLSAGDTPIEVTDAGGVAPAASPATEPWWSAVWQQARDGSLTAAGLALAALLALWALVRRRREGGRAPRVGQRYVDGAAVMPNVYAPSHVEATPPQAAALDDSPAEEAPAARPMPQAEAISEADIFMAYGRYDQARELLEAGLDEEPERYDLRLKLLTVYVEQGAWGDAEREAETLRRADDPALQVDVERLMARLQGPGDAAVAAQAAEFDTVAEPEPEPEPVISPLASMDSGESPRVIDYRPPALEPSAPRDETPMQPSVEFEPSALQRPADEEWEVEEVAFEPLHLDNDRPAAVSPHALLDVARQRLDQGQTQAARSLLDQVVSEARGDAQLEGEARRLIAQHDL